MTFTAKIEVTNEETGEMVTYKLASEKVSFVKRHDREEDVLDFIRRQTTITPLPLGIELFRFDFERLICESDGTLYTMKHENGGVPK